MGLARFSIYQYARTSKGWRYSRPFYGKNNKLQPKAVLVDGTYLPPSEKFQDAIGSTPA